MRVALSTATNERSESPAPAGIFYQGKLFTACREYAACSCDAYFILSFHYGLVGPDQVLVWDPRDWLSKNMPRAALLGWSVLVASRLLELVPPPAEIDLLTDGVAKEFLPRVLTGYGYTVFQPFQGLSYDHQMDFLRQQIEQHVPSV
jgi:hypothetical protein